MPTDADASYMECLLRIDTSDGWEASVTKVLASFKDLRYEINASLGFIYVKGKTNPHLILTKLKKGGKHATIEWVSYGFPRADQHQIQNVENGHNQHLIGPNDPFSHARYPYENYYQLNPPYYSWHNMAQNALPFNGHEPNEHYEGGSSSGHSHNHHHCPMHSLHHHSPSSSQSGLTLVPNSSQSIQLETFDQANNNPTSKQSSRFEKFLLPCLWLCSKK